RRQLRPEHADEAGLLPHLPQGAVGVALAPVGLALRQRPVVVAGAVHDQDPDGTPVPAAPDETTGGPDVIGRRGGVFGGHRDAGEPRPESAGIAGYRLGSPVAGPAGAVVSTAGPELARDARHRHRGAEIGALGEALARAGVARGVVGNADRALGPLPPGADLASDPYDPSTYHREAARALADHAGVVPAGEVGRSL